MLVFARAMQHNVKTFSNKINGQIKWPGMHRNSAQGPKKLPTN